MTLGAVGKGFARSLRRVAWIMYYVNSVIVVVIRMG
jgi:hypothetical protein